MFGSLLKDFEEDPFFSDPFRAHQEHVRQMMRSFSDPFGRDPFFSTTDGRSRGRRGQEDTQVALREDHRASSLCHMPHQGFSNMSSDLMDPFHSMDNMMTNMRNRMLNIHKQFEGLADNPDSHLFSSSSVMTYSKVGDEPPKIFQATSQTRKAPGGIKETKKAIRDSETGIEKMAIGHHIKDRGHVIKKSVNNKTGDRELNQEFLNIDEEEAPQFNDEWVNEISKYTPAEEKPKIKAQEKQKSVHHAKIGTRDLARRDRCISKMVI
ncbi:myeloid leukemia factor 1 isoform X2 [Bombina bombina]|uniref:myeloid leukemia factor 1 isoform X2 n=1 Tax=Bombina bombina TaxID=8345 RepID=UPI00235B0852|nr:myeloid leukemia factor 1 isoform X2 [Bombina bombina]